MRKEKVCCIYMITSPSGKIYIGQSMNFNERLTFYKNGHGDSQIKLHRSILKYGWNNHKCEIICQCEINELNELESQYIKIFKTFNSVNGLNLTEGGGNGKRSEESRIKMSQSQTGKKRSLESRRKQSKNRTGKKYSPEKIKKIVVIKSLAKKIAKIPVPLGRKKKILLCTLTGIFYLGVKEAAYSMNVPQSTLGKKLCGIDKNDTQFVYV